MTHAERILSIGEKDYLGFTFRGDDLPTGVTIASGTVVVSPATGLTLGSGTAVLTTDSDGVYAWVTAVTAGEYFVTFTATFSDTKVLKRVYRVVIPEPTLTAKNILTVDQARTFLKNDAGVDETYLEHAIDMVSTRFADYLGTMSLRKTTYTSQRVDGTGRRHLYLPAWPVVSISALSEDGTALTENTDYYADYNTGVLERVQTITPAISESGLYVDSGYWINKRRAIVISYVAGYDITGTITLPYAIKAAALTELGRAIQTMQHKLWGEESRSTDGGSSTFNLDEFLPDTIATLRRFRRIKL